MERDYKPRNTNYWPQIDLPCMFLLHMGKDTFYRPSAATKSVSSYSYKKRNILKNITVNVLAGFVEMV